MLHDVRWRQVRRLTVIALVLATAIVGRIGAQTPTAPALVSTSTGVYTTAQAERGEQTYSNNCLGCHTTSSYTAASFRAAWNGRPIWELFSFISDTMPEDFPGALSPKEYAQVIAYVLKLNRVPAGQTELPPDPEALKKIKIDIGER